MKNFGLMEQSGSTYSMTDIAKRIFHPQSPEEKAVALAEAFSHNEYLNWADYFLEAATYAGILHEVKAGSYVVLLQPATLYPQTKAPDKGKPTEVVPIEVPTAKPSIESQRTHTNGFDLDGTHWGILNKKKLTNGMAIFAVPDQLTQQEIESLKLVLKGIESMLDGLKKQDEY